MITGVNPLSMASIASELNKITESHASKQAVETQAPGASFADFMNNLGTTFVDNVKGAEKVSTDGILGKASAREVVESVMAADQTLQTAMAFRDKIVSAYLEIVKMPV